MSYEWVKYEWDVARRQKQKGQIRLFAFSDSNFIIAQFVGDFARFANFISLIQAIDYGGNNTLDTHVS